MAAIPAPWYNTTEMDKENQKPADQQEAVRQENVVVGKAAAGKGGRKRGSAEQKSGTGKRAKVQQQQHVAEADENNSCSDDDEPKEIVMGERENAKSTAGQKKAGTSKNRNSGSPGVPMAQSTPMVPSSSARSAFAMLQPQSIAMYPPTSQQYLPAPHHHFAPAPVGYFFPPPPQSVVDQSAAMFHHHPPPTAYHPFMHWAGTGPPGYPPGGLMMPLAKMEPPPPQLEFPEHLLMKLDMGGCNGHQGQKRRPKAKKVTKNGAGEDSGLGADALDASGNFNTTVDDTFATANITIATTNNDGDGDGRATANNIVQIGPLAVAPLPLHPIQGFETYCTVPGRLTLLSNLKKYRVSIAEIQRRLAPPECLNASILGGILRKAKNKDGGRLLREQLMTYGVELTSGRRKQGPLTCFSSLVEEEAAQLALDFNVINQKHYPHKEAAAYAMTEVQNAQDASLCRMELYYASKFLNRMLDFHRADCSPAADQPKLEDALMAELSPELQTGLTIYSLMTHSFGGRVVKSVLDSMQSVINECGNVLNRNYASTSQQVGAAAPPIPLGYKY